MSKAILVIDMPDSCDKCPCFCGYYSDMYCKALNNRGIDYPYPENFRQDWCPLKALPEKMKVKQYKGNGVYGIVTAQEAHYAMGWNGCLDKLLDNN